MKLYVVDAFSERVFGGNQAGVVLLDDSEDFPESKLMINIAAELKHSETAFVKPLQDGHSFDIKYYTPNKEVELCGHATVSVFTVLRDENIIKTGEYTAKTLAGDLNVKVEENIIWLQMAEGKLIKELTEEESKEVYNAYGISMTDKEDGIPCVIADTGLSDILLPVKSREALNNAKQNKEEVIRISKKYNAAGVFMFYLSYDKDLTAYTRSFAPLYAIDEECATGTATGALTYYLSKLDMINNDTQKFIQGEAMNRPSVILSRIDNEGNIYVGGSGIISIYGKINL